MTILVLSDSHSALSFMRRCVDAVRPDAIVHLGDYFEDGTVLAEEYPHIPIYQVPGNCDRYRCGSEQPEVLVTKVLGVPLYMTHGHLHNVKFDTGRLIRSAQAQHVQAALYGHTHSPECYREDDGMWVMNPGSCGAYGGTAGLIRVQDGKILSCHIVRQRDLEEMK